MFTSSEGDPDVWHDIYLGAAGVLWALDYLVVALFITYARLAGEVLEELPRPSRVNGPGAYLMDGRERDRTEWRGGWRRSDALADRLAELVAVPDDDTPRADVGQPRAAC